MKVVNYFDGMAGGREALKRIGVKPERYQGFEIDKYAMQIASKNHPDIIHGGDVTKANLDNIGDIDLAMAGSPCQGFSFAGKQLNFTDPRSRLFFNFIDLLSAKNPKYFLLENVKMKKEYQDVITKYMGVEPVEINSSLFCAQNRRRLYWTNIPFNRDIEDKNILLKDIIEHEFVDRDKSYCLDANYFKGTNLEQYLKKKRRQIVFNYSSSGRGNGRVEHRFYESENAKAHTLTKTGYTKRSFTGVYNEKGFRKLTPIECERLQTFPDNYTEGVSNTQRYKMLGNGWTVDVIAHILKGIK